MYLLIYLMYLCKNIVYIDKDIFYFYNMAYSSQPHLHIHWVHLMYPGHTSEPCSSQSGEWMHYYVAKRWGNAQSTSSGATAQNWWSSEWKYLQRGISNKRKVHISLYSTHITILKSVATDFTAKSAWTMKKSEECL